MTAADPAADREALVAVARAHAEAEAEADLEGTMDTLGAELRYELLPMGVSFGGREMVREYYERFFVECLPRISGYTLRSEWVTDEGLGQEYQLSLDGPDGPERHDIIGILTFGTDGLLSGERLYASDRLLQFMFGPLLDRATPVTGGPPSG